MKSLILIFIFFVTVTLDAGEVVFIPGWFSETISFVYEPQLRKYFPEDKISILTWESAVSWKKAVENADRFLPRGVEYIASKSAHEQENIILVGYSLGGRIVVNVAKILAQRGIAVKQIILLGAAVDYDVNLTECIKSSRLPLVNIFCRNDSILKYLYANACGRFALGYCGHSQPEINHFEQYNFSTSEIEISNTNLKTSWREIGNHMVKNYFRELDFVMSGIKKPYRPAYDYSNVSVSRGLLASALKNIVIPPLGNVNVIESYADWMLAEVSVHTKKENEKKRSIFVIYDHYGRIYALDFFKSMAQRRFEKICSQIIKLNYN